ncbi:molybdopterin oxidoreductase family protein [Hydrogenimonas thermophila]|uniref:Formate dehydrogenase major subunit n=1 Tax=Hydrogenimonas thermophila TaxID=223786 RepID=A0A1I5RIR8_9BACT|nr:molybdopterin-dependent oxidoreductase [Hydrogenimonas thermophila]WOE69698.1 molybdopterin-dependent oxidoreductase [Hydrogenimonas thermophila]WOE72212.1 molybdopterin-dependent oxidoreductase [Hydrogenimonas thermophila]SFP58464.1 formate dehydrogenase major subunit [Hydrogenimonas thermophila]
MNYTEVESVCTYCGVGCDIVAQVDDNKIHKITADKDGYVSQGKLCIKGKYGFDFVDSKERIRKPRIAKHFLEKNPHIKAKIEDSLEPLDENWFTTDLQTAVNAAAMKLMEIRKSYGDESFCAIGGARTSCESAYLFQKFTRDSMNSPHVDNCARVCHSPSLKGMRATIGEGAATNPYNDIYEAEFILIIGSNTTEAHPIVANRIIDVARLHDNVAVIDVREIKMMKYAKHKAVIPHEANLLVLNMMAYVILKDELYNKKFVESRTKGFEEYKEKILNDPYANPEFFKQVPGYEYLATLIPIIAREYALKKSMIFWGLGVTEHIDGSYAVMAITHLALLTGNIGKTGAGLMPLRGQNNVQGACDMGCLPYYEPDYQKPKKVGLMTPQLVDAMLEGKIKALLNMGEDIAHIHPNQNKIDKALNELEFIMVQELFMTEIAKRADIVIGVKSAYEKEGVYVNAMRRLHLSQPIVKSDLPDDWEVIKMLDNAMGGNYDYKTSEDVWNEVREVAHRRFSGASYLRLKRHRKRGLQWPVYTEDTPVLHLLDFRTEDGLGKFVYHQYQLRGMIEELMNGGVESGYYLTTGRTLPHYNNAAQTIQSEKLNNRYDEDILLVSEVDADRFPNTEYVILRSQYGESAPLRVKFTEKIKPNTLFTTFHHAKSRINYLFGDASDELILTAAFKSIKVEVLPA